MADRPPPPALSLDPAETRARAIRRIAAAFTEGGLDEPLREARLVLLAACRLTSSDLILHGDSPLGEDARHLESFAYRRLTREPLARITGQREFYGLPFGLSDATLIPRPDTETLVEATLDHARALGLDTRPIRILDLGTGSGAILAALLAHLPLAHGTGVDISSQAIETAKQNIDRAGGPGRAELRIGNWLNGLDGAFEIIVSNPPYIPSGEIAGLEPEVALHDPLLALDGGADGLEAYRTLAREIPSRLAVGGLVGLELGIGQADAVQRLFSTAGLICRELRQDLGGIARAMVFSRPE